MNTGPFSSPGRFWRGNLHTHSTRSDGHIGPEEVCAFYRAHGYDFLALTDHFLERYEYPITDTRSCVVPRDIHQHVPPQMPCRRPARRGSERRPRLPELPPQEPAQDPSQGPIQDPATADIDPATAGPEEDDEGRLPDIAEESGGTETALQIAYCLSALTWGQREVGRNSPSSCNSWPLPFAPTSRLATSPL